MTVNVPLKIQTSDEPQTVAIVGDIHIPFHDCKSLSLVEDFLEEIQPQFLIYNGDITDFYQISKYDKDPSRISKLEEDVNDTRLMFRRHKAMLPNTKKVMLEGTHEDRLRRYLWSRAPELSSLKCLSIPELFRLPDYEIEFIPYEQGLMLNSVFLVIHGDLVSVHSGYTAKRMYEKHGGCGVCGHCHRLGSFYKRDRFGTKGWWEGGCLCDLDPDWVKNPNWVQGFTLVHFRGKQFWVEQVPIIDHKFIYGGKLYQ
jgi:predicted phosphodiesterase